MKERYTEDELITKDINVICPHCQRGHQVRIVAYGREKLDILYDRFRKLVKERIEIDNKIEYIQKMIDKTEEYG